MIKRKPKHPVRREYDIAKRGGDGLFGIWRWMQCPFTPPLMSTPKAKDEEAKVIHIHRRWILVEVRRSFKAALKWIRARQEEVRNASISNITKP